MIEFDAAGLDRYIAEDTGGPVVMMNLLRFRPADGAAKYAAYSEQFVSTGLYGKYGVELTYAGHCSTMLVGPDG